MKTPVTRREAIEMIAELEEIIAGAKAREDLLLDYIDNICGIIEAQCPLKEQDLWLADMKRFGLYPTTTYDDDDDDDEVFGLA